jgi:serine protease AprX
MTGIGTALAVAGLAGAVPAAASTPRRTTRVVVTAADDAAAARIGTDLRRHGARHLRELAVVHGYSADVPAPYVEQLRRTPGVRSVTVDRGVHLLSVNPDLGYDPVADFGSLYEIAKVLGAQDAWNNGYTGKGVDVALVDSGVAPVAGLTSGNVVNGPDLSFESQSAGLKHLDSFGHGTHMASVIAGRDVVLSGPGYYNDTNHFSGVAPDARVVSVKVADHSGATDVSQVIAGIDWVVAHAHDNGLNVRVLNLSFGTDSTQPARIDPLCFAVENAWRHGIAVVVAGGNDGNGATQLANPAQDPYVIAVGADDPRGTVSVSDDVVPTFSSRGSSARHVDVVAPAVHVLGLRDPDSSIDQANQTARVGTRFFRGSGTSQAAAAVSGAAALLLSRFPNLTPDQVKKQLMATATPFDAAGPQLRGNGVVNVRRAMTSPPSTTAAQPTASYGTGTGSLEASRGSYHVGDGTSVLTGEKDIFGNAFNAAAWANATSMCLAWDGGTWMGAAWSGNAWSSDDWTGNAWSTTQWTGNAWSGNAWSDASWSGHTWTGNAWSGNAWSGSAWSGAAWSGAAWSGAAWSGSAWSSSIWE